MFLHHVYEYHIVRVSSVAMVASLEGGLKGVIKGRRGQKGGGHDEEAKKGVKP